jgi:pyruvate dehydrogenase E1 component beta subunit
VTYKDIIARKCKEYGAHPMARFIGYNTLKGSRMYGTLSDVPRCRCIETPVSENLMMGLAMGMSLQGFRPVVCFERHDFMLLALDAIVNHLDKLPKMGECSFPVVIRAIVGGKRPLDAGMQHTQNYTLPMSLMLRYVDIVEPDSEREFEEAWDTVKQGRPVIIVEYKDSYGLEVLREESPPSPRAQSIQA